MKFWQVESYGYLDMEYDFAFSFNMEYPQSTPYSRLSTDGPSTARRGRSLFRSSLNHAVLQGHAGITVRP